MNKGRLVFNAVLAVCMAGSAYKYFSLNADKSQTDGNKSLRGYTLVKNINDILRLDELSSLDAKLGKRNFFVTISYAALSNNNKDENSSESFVENTRSCVAKFILRTIGSDAADAMRDIMKDKASAHIKSQLLCLDFSGDGGVVISGTFETDCTQNNSIVTCVRKKLIFYVKTEFMT